MAMLTMVGEVRKLRTWNLDNYIVDITCSLQIYLSFVGKYRAWFSAVSGSLYL